MKEKKYIVEYIVLSISENKKAKIRETVKV